MAKLATKKVTKNETNKGTKLAKRNPKYNIKKKKIKGYRKGNGAIYLGHIPHGFYEDEITSYFQQFGKVISVKLARSRNTGRSKGYGFVEFADEEVAKIAAETMNNYLMYNRILKCSYISRKQWRGNKFPQKISTKDYPRKKNRQIDAKNKSNAIYKTNQKHYQRKAQKKIEKFQGMFKNKGIDYTFKVEP